MDLFVLLKSFLPKGGEINSVSVYPSEFGLEQMKQEESQGPKGVFEKNDDDEDDDDGVDMEKLRQYEKAKLRSTFQLAVPLTCGRSVLRSCRSSVRRCMFFNS